MSKQTLTVVTELKLGRVTRAHVASVEQLRANREEACSYSRLLMPRQIRWSLGTIQIVCATAEEVQGIGVGVWEAVAAATLLDQKEDLLEVYFCPPKAEWEEITFMPLDQCDKRAVVSLVTIYRREPRRNRRCLYLRPSVPRLRKEQLFAVRI